MKLFIETAVQENYGSHDWDGQGNCPQGWKNKSGSTYVIENCPLGVDRLKEMVEIARTSVACDNDYWREWIIDWYVESDSHKTKYELQQEEYARDYGCTHPIFRPEVLDLDEILKEAA